MRRVTTLCVLLIALSSALFGADRRRVVLHPKPPTALPPNAAGDQYSVGRGKTLTVNTTSGVLANDTDPQNRVLTAILASGPSHGTLTLNPDGGFTYTNDNSANATDSFTYKATNGISESAPAVVQITILPPTPPVALSDSYSTTQGTALTVAAPGVLSNDTLNGASIASYGAATGAEQTATGSTTPTAQNGSVTLNANGSFTYTPLPTFTGSDSFRYVLRNSDGSSTGTATITVQAPAGPDFIVTSPGFFYRISGLSGENPVLTLQRGRTYRFQISTSSDHPFEIAAPENSVTNNNISNGIITFAVPASSESYSYACSIHGFGNSIQTTP